MPPARKSFQLSLYLLALTICIAVSHQGKPPQGPRLRVAAAADLQFAMNELAGQYEAQNHVTIDVTYGSSGNFFSQIQNGAPFDLFFSADITYPQQLQAAGLAEPGTLNTYAEGQLVLWAPPDSKLDVATQKWNSLLDGSVQKIAIANPQHAPYGSAAVAALQKAGIYEQVRTKLVYGENISQAAQFVQSGNAQVGIVAKSLAVSPAMKNGQSWEIPPGMYPPIEQAAILVKNAANKATARSFLEFVKGESGRAVLQRYGFAVPAWKRIAEDAIRAGG